jgi:tetratricopeptide (TPR) repeat protein/TolB-like protein
MEPQVGPYRIVERLGAGGMGEVYLAEDPRLGRRVALKRLSDPALTLPDARARLLREAAMAATLNHPNIATIYDVLEWEGVPFLVMEYVPGDTLASQVKRGPLTIDRVVQIGLQLCDALAEAHAHGVVHRDLKPANVRITPEGRVKILDFGLAHRPVHSLPADAGPTAIAQSLAAVDGQLVGTPAYIAPEVLLGRSAGPRADIYALGVTLFELATGRLPFAGENFLGMALAILTEPAPRVTELLPGGLGEIVERAMARERSERYQTVAQVRRDLSSLSAELTDLPTGVMRLPDMETTPAVVAAPPSAAPVSHRHRWNRRTVAIAGAVLAALLALLILLVLRGTKASAAGPPVVAVLPLQGMDADGGALGAGIASALTSDLAATPGLTVVSRLGPLDPHELADVPRLARDLGATYLVSGAAQVAGDRLRINLQVVRPDGAVAVGKSAEGARGDLFRLQRQLAVEVAEFVRGEELNQAERARLASRPTTSPDAFDAYSRGRALLERPDVSGNLDQAIVAFQQALAIDPRFAPAQAGGSEASWSQYQVTADPAWAARATTAALAARDLDPGSAQVRVALARVLDGTGQSDRALTELAAAVALQPNDDEAYRLRGEILAARADWANALAAIHKAIDVRPGYWGNYRSLGLALSDAGRFDEALDAFRHVVELVPDNAWGYQLLGTTYQQMGKLDRAREEYGRAVAHGGTPATYSNLGALDYAEGHYEDALRQFRKAADLLPDSASMARNVGDTLQRLGRRDEAVEWYGRAVTLARQDVRVNPGDAHAQAALAVFLAKQGHADAAAESIEKALSLGTPDATIWYRAVVVHTLAGRPTQALDDLARALQAGYSVSQARTDDDLALLRPLPEFKQMTAAPAAGRSPR